MNINFNYILTSMLKNIYIKAILNLNRINIKELILIWIDYNINKYKIESKIYINLDFFIKIVDFLIK